MPPFPGEERLVTVFADIHYYFAQPTVRPLLHRFDKASYFYIYYNSTRHTSRIEIANNPGTTDQDAFNGYIDTCRITNSHRFPTLLTIEVDGAPTSPSSPKAGRDPEEWCLTSADPRDANRSKYRLHTLDVYFWAQEDARLVIECFKKLLPQNQLDVAELEPEQPHRESAKQDQAATAMSPMVQNLENLAVSDQYNGQRRQKAASPTSSFASYNLPPPPPAGGQQIHSPSPAISDMSSQPTRETSVRGKPQSTDFTPIPYNPAAPAAPEPIAHREKTPPPDDGADGTGLSQAARHDQGYVPGPPSQGGYQPGQGPPGLFGGGYASPPPQQPGYTSPPPQQPGFVSPPPQQQSYTSPPPQQQGYTSPPPQQHGYSSPAPGSSGGYGAPPSTTGYQSPPPQSNYSHQDQRSSMTSTAPSFGPGAPSTTPSQRHSTAAENYIPHQTGPQQPVMTPGSQFYGSLGQPSKPLAHVQPQYADYLSSGSTPVQSQYTPASASPNPPMGGYSQYNYGHGQGQGQPQGENQNPYNVHQQVYRPTEAEAGSHHHKKPSRTSTTDSRKPSTADKVEKGVGRLFKRIEKRIG
ncbi:hypothetical protein OHC33_006365 [Knufia fluminis]|uniref:Uncharacterized protein n=1 Tax=Knufia fluminis TaxID=191047 RepID=A0AAN8I3K0_9EURO|nr:hypothetical protein OHC33_006365 [Knufia fluminis]